ncbi:hypothetical protein ACJIZ3_006903 [Penstemon smallii]|uniref:F-box domain-containing protein n=1 Tax=Penstemon smallii TaxID=265156 RepID=A0ABD3S989_9LAMI
MAELSEASRKHRTTINNLPESLLLHILSFLMTLDTIKTSLVCRNWRYLWYQIPSLMFDIVPFHSPPYISLCIRPPSHLESFCLHVDCGDDLDIAIVVSWVLYAINSKVIELDLDFNTSSLYYILVEENDETVSEEFKFDFSHLKNSSVRHLRLSRSTICFPSSVSTSDFQSIQSLDLCNLIISDSDVDQAVKSCVNLEYLAIQHCRVSNHLEIYSLKLKQCHIGCVYPNSYMESSMLVIYAPNLQIIHIDDVLIKKCILKESPDLVFAQVRYYHIVLLSYESWCNLMSSLAYTKYLIVQNMYFGKAELLKLFDTEEDALQCYKFKNLRHLQLLSGYTGNNVIGICSFLEHSHTLESLVINYCDDSDEEDNNDEDSDEEDNDDEDNADEDIDDEEGVTEDYISRPVTLHIPRLRHVTMNNYRGSQEELYILGLLKIHQVVLEEVVAIPEQTGDTKLMPFPLWRASDCQ